MGHNLNFFPLDQGEWVALQGVPLEAGSGHYSIQLTGTLADGASFNFSQPIFVKSGDYETASLSVDDPTLLDPELNIEETTQVDAIVAPVTPTRLWSGLWGWPHDLVNDVTSGFGLFRTYNGGEASSFHTGVDFGGGALLAIYAPAPGKVVFAGPLEIRGNATYIDHGWGVYTAYFHQNEIDVSVGDTVEAGQVIGIVGATGRVTGPHLHWEVWVGGVPVQPLDWLQRVYP